MTEPEPYGSPAAVEAAIRDAARNAFARDPSVSVSERIRQEHFHRFLSRVFSEEEDSEWLLKGGTGMLARVPSARTTKDIDLYRSGFTLDQALHELRRLASIDLGDHFRFVYTGHTASVVGEGQPYTDGYSVYFDVYVGAQKRTQLRVDLAVGAGLTAEVTRQTPANALRIPRLMRHDYRLYPVADQIADKVCATMMLYSGSPSSCEKDLIDLVVFAATHDVDGDALLRAIQTEARRRGLEPFTRFVIPSGWGAAYARMAKSVPHCSDSSTVDRARALMAEFIDPVLGGAAEGARWSHASRGWTANRAR